MFENIINFSLMTSAAERVSLMGLLPKKGVFFEEDWEVKCQKQLSSVFNPSSKNKIRAASLYNSIYHFCVAVPEDFLIQVYQRIGFIFIQESSSSLSRIQSQLEDINLDEIDQLEYCNALLKSYCNSWRLYNKGTKKIDRLCMYVNKVICKLLPNSSSSDFTSSSSTISPFVSQSTEQSQSAVSFGEKEIPDHLATIELSINGCPQRVSVKSVGLLGLFIWKTAILDSFPINPNHLKCITNFTKTFMAG
jgi:hypothetical protein